MCYTIITTIQNVFFATYLEKYWLVYVSSLKVDLSWNDPSTFFHSKSWIACCPIMMIIWRFHICIWIGSWCCHSHCAFIFAGSEVNTNLSLKYNEHWTTPCIPLCQVMCLWIFNYLKYQIYVLKNLYQIWLWQYVMLLSDYFFMHI